MEPSIQGLGLLRQKYNGTGHTTEGGIEPETREGMSELMDLSLLSTLCILGLKGLRAAP